MVELGDLMITRSEKVDWNMTTMLPTELTTTSNSTHLDCTDEYSLQIPTASLTWSRFAWSAIQWIVFVVGTSGNLLLLMVLVWRRFRSNVVTQIFVGSLSVAGLALMLSSGWVQGLVFMKDDFPFGRWTCKVLYFWQANSVYCHCWNLVAVAFDRYKGLNNPASESLIRTKRAVVVVTAIWLMTSASNIPMIFWSDVTTDESTGLRRCLITGVDPTARAIQITLVRIGDYLVPLIITWTCYVGIIIQMKTALRKVVPAIVATKSVGLTAANPNGSSGSRKVTVMCMAISVCFTVTSLPHQIDFCIVGYASSAVAATANGLAMYFRLGTMLNTCMNPFIYGLMWRPFRIALVKTIEDLTRCCRRSEIVRV